MREKTKECGLTIELAFGPLNPTASGKNKFAKNIA
jgi:hypothetical protein